MSMEFLRANYLDTTTSIDVDSNTALSSYLIDRDPQFQYVSQGYSGVTNTTIRVRFNETLTVSRLALLNHNLKGFTFYYNGVTANTFALLNGNTSTLDYSGNSDTSQYFSVTPVYATSVSLQCKTTMVSGVEKAIGWLMISDVLTQLSRTPNSKGYKPNLNPQEVVHKLSDGGTRVQTISDKFSCEIQFSYLSQTDRDALKTLYNMHTEMIFCPFGTCTSWDQVIFPCVWFGPFEFYNYSDDAVNAGFTGRIRLAETPT